MKIKEFIIHLDYFIKSIIIKILSQILFASFNDEKINKILIFRTGSMGDSICSLPAIKIIRDNFPNAHITILYNAGGNNLASIENLLDHNIVNEFINYAEIPYKQLLKQLREKKYDTFIEFPQVHQPFKSYLRNIIFAKSMGVKYALGWKIAATRLFPSIQDKHRKFISVREHFITILKKENFKIPRFLEYPLNFQDKDIEKINAIFKKHNLESQNIVGIVVGAKRPQNRWPIFYFDKVIEHLISKNYTIIVIGGEEDTAIAQKLKTYSQILDLTGKLTPLQSAEALKRCKFVVSNDTGPMHLAYAVNTYVFAIFSSRDYRELWYPPKDKSVVFRNNDINCLACFSEICPNNLCMQEIKPDSVIKAIDNYIQLNY